MRQESLIKQMFEEGYTLELIAEKVNATRQSIQQHVYRKNMKRQRHDIKYSHHAIKAQRIQSQLAPVIGCTIVDDCYRILNRKLLGLY